MKNNLLKIEPEKIPVYHKETITSIVEPVNVWKETYNAPENSFITINDLKEYFLQYNLKPLSITLMVVTTDNETVTVDGLVDFNSLNKDIVKGITQAVLYYNQTVPSRTSETYKQLKKQVIHRDIKCMVCGRHEDLTIHHIEPFKNNNLSCYSLDNCVTLCKSCHKEYHCFSGVDDVNARNWTEWLLTKLEFKDLYRDYNDYERWTGEKQG